MSTVGNLIEYLESALRVAVASAAKVEPRAFMSPIDLADLLTAMVAGHGMVAAVRLDPADTLFWVRFSARNDRGDPTYPIYHRYVFDDEDLRLHDGTLSQVAIRRLAESVDKAIAAHHGTVP